MTSASKFSPCSLYFCYASNVNLSLTAATGREAMTHILIQGPLAMEVAPFQSFILVQAHSLFPLKLMGIKDCDPIYPAALLAVPGATPLSPTSIASISTSVFLTSPLSLVPEKKDCPGCGVW